MARSAVSITPKTSAGGELLPSGMAIEPALESEWPELAHEHPDVRQTATALIA